MNKNIKSMGIIMDGNRRWAVKNKMPKVKGHEYGAEKIKDVVEWSKEKNIKNLTLYAFSTENWKRSKSEVEAIMSLLEKFISGDINKLIKEKVSVRFIGDLSRFTGKVQDLMKKVEEKSKGFDFTLFIAMSYGGRLEIVEAVKKIVNNKDRDEINNLTEKEFEKFLWTSDLIDPDIIIRTGGDKRLSNFLLWKASYSEIYFTDKLWPEFEKKDFMGIIDEYCEKVKINLGS